MGEAFDESQYVMVREAGTFDAPVGKSTIRVGVFRYKDGPEKVKIQRGIPRKSGDTFYKEAGGMSVEEVKLILPLLSSAVGVEEKTTGRGKKG